MNKIDIRLNSLLSKITLAGGCFWCTEAIFQRLKGVEEVVSGYASSENASKPSYEQVSSGETSFAEAIQISFNPEIISLETLLDVFFHTHNPTTLNQQGADTGLQYRSAVFYADESQKDVVERKISDLAESGEFEDEIVTTVEPLVQFYEAENYHKDYYNSNRNQGYCQIVIDPKIKKMYNKYKELVKKEE